VPFTCPHFPQRDAALVDTFSAAVPQDPHPARTSTLAATAPIPMDTQPAANIFHILFMAFSFC
jgi:hypothetical protein